MRIRSVLVLLSAWLALALPAQAAPDRHVLVLYSNSRLLPANLEIDRGLRDVLAAPDRRNLEHYSEFLGLPVFSGREHERAMATYLGEKYRAHAPTVIVVVGGPALDFMLRERAGLFPDVPVVHVAVDKDDVRPLEPLPADVVGAVVEFDFARTIDLALTLHPRTRRVVVVTGTSEWDRAWESRLRAGLPRLGIDARIEYLAGLSTDALATRLSGLGPGDVVYTPGYFTDGAGIHATPRDTATRIAAISAAPVYCPYSTYLGTGMVGGVMPTFVDMGRQAATAVTALLGGAAPADLDLPREMPAVAQLDWRQARRWNIDPGLIPRDAILHFREPSFWEANRAKILAVGAIIALQAALIAALLLERRRRQRTASALAESEARMSLAATAARLSMWIWDVTRNRFWATTRLPHDDGRSTETPMHFDQVLRAAHPADRDALERAARRAVSQDEELDIEYRMLLPDGEVRWIAARGRAEKTADGERLVGVALDVTPRKAAEQQAEKDRAALTHMTRVSMMGQLSASIAHQLNQPLAAILGNAEVARKLLQRGDPDLVELAEICDDIITEDHRAAEVIRRLGALYKRGELVVAPLDLNELVLETLDLVRTELNTRQVAVATGLAPSLPLVEGGRIELQQVLLNLILNAADAMREVPMHERRLLVRTEFDGAGVRLCVVDRGTGIAAGDLKHVFDAFWSTKASGIGVGLAICRSIVAAHKGGLAASNNPGGGATFCVTLPLRQPA